MLPTGFISYVSIDRIFQQTLSRPYSNCDITESVGPDAFDSEFYRLVFYSSYEYKQEICLFQCLQRKTIDVCNCTNPRYLSLYNDSEQCDTQIQNECLKMIFNENYLTTYISQVTF
jgi:hypothetical protein